jgi:hypothetical protein
MPRLSGGTVVFDAVVPEYCAASIDAAYAKDGVEAVNAAAGRRAGRVLRGGGSHGR